jgi:hypothetical protein
MSRHARRIRRASLAAAVAALAGTLSGCLLPPLPGAEPQPSASKPAARPEPEPSITITDKGKIGAMSFADGDALAASAIPQWSDGLLADDGWTLTTPDTGAGRWGYTTADGTCTASFWQGRILDMAAEDDLTASDFILATLLKVDVAALEGRIDDGTIGYMFPDNPVAEYRYLQGSEPGRSWVIVARGFAQTKSALYFDVDCASDRAAEVSREVVSKTAIAVQG